MKAEAFLKSNPVRYAGIRQLPGNELPGLKRMI